MSDKIYYIVTALFYGLGIFCAGLAVLRSRTPQGATAWVLSLLFIPFFSVPLFLVFGQTKFEGYNNRRRFMDKRVQAKITELSSIDSTLSSTTDELKLISSTISAKNQPGFTRGNSIQLLIDGDETFSSMLSEIEKAKKYIILQTYIFRDDEIGNKFADLLIRKATEGLRVTFIHDDIGNDIPVRLIKKLSKAGIKVSPFNDRLIKHKVQINFRNHRKILIIDGKVGFVGGLNIGDDYLGRWKKWGPWRDTHVKISGPSVIAAQVACAKDWYFSIEEPIEADWEITESSENAQVMILHTGPADERHTCLLAHIAMINSAQERLWIASPYLVPPESLVDALFMASLRGVDVCLILPSYSDAILILHASKVYQERMLDHGIKLFSYTPGFLHQKVMLIDSKIATVGSANFDCRSMFINFEVTAITTDNKFITDMEEMLIEDFARSQRVDKEKLKEESIMQKISARSANLLAPML